MPFCFADCLAFETFSVCTSETNNRYANPDLTGSDCCFVIRRLSFCHFFRICAASEPVLLPHRRSARRSDGRKKSVRIFCGTEKVYYLCNPIRGSAYQMVDVAQLVRALDCGSRCRGFESHLPPPPLQKEYDVEKRGLSAIRKASFSLQFGRFGSPGTVAGAIGACSRSRVSTAVIRRTDRRPCGIPTSRDNGSRAPAHGSDGPAARGSALRDSP